MGKTGWGRSGWELEGQRCKRRRKDDVFDRCNPRVEFGFGKGQFPRCLVRAVFLEGKGELQGGYTLKKISVC